MLEPDLPPHSYRCKVVIESDVPVVDPSGNPSPNLVSNTVEFDVK